MTDWKGIVKNGWHPEKEGASLKDQMKGLIGRGESTTSHTSSSHSAMPITSLRDPSSFGPPPKRVGSGTHSPASATPQYQPPDDQAHGVQQAEKPPVEAKPYQINTTGLSTSHLPPPPARKDGADRQGQDLGSPLSATRPSGPPSLPPRPARRSGNTSPAQAQSPVSTGGSQQTPSTGFLNQGAISRLSAAGISVPGLGIGKKSPPPPPPNRTPSPTKASGGRMSEFTNRFSRFGSNSPKPELPAKAASPPVPAKGTSWKEKQAALKTAANFRKDPTSVSFTEMKAAAGTAHNFQQRHGEQVAAGMRTADKLGQKFGVYEQNGQGASNQSPMGHISVIAGKKQPPPRPAKKPTLSTISFEGSAPAPPPIPTGTRPRF